MVVWSIKNKSWKFAEHWRGILMAEPILSDERCLKNDQAVMEQEREIFLYGLEDVCCGAIQNGVPKEVAESIFDEISRFASYAFNKSHAVAYAYLAYQTAYLKCHYFSAYMAALMTSVIGDFPKLLSYISECQKGRRSGIAATHQ